MKLADFEGDWQLRREIDDFHGDTKGHLIGTASFTADAQGLNYVETGQLFYAGRTAMTATRRYLWRDIAGQITVLFGDGRDFHHIAAGQVDHLCGDDLYRVAYDFADWPQWSTDWRVSGPRKDYRMRSIYTQDRVK